ncbi:MAG: hypothetical protein HDR24_00400 [Lachnospiraceae bacterium]|nr:hypothetical protein [Lachnospiraceae bacterium]
MEMILIGIIMAFCIAFPVACIYAIAKTVKDGKERRRQQKQDKTAGIKRFSNLEHVEGLDVAEKSPCTVLLGPSALTISCTGKEYTLPLRRVIYIDFFTDAETIRYLQSSMAKGIVGGALFGTSGAVIGAAPKTKVVREATGHAVIGYVDASGKEKMIILRDQRANSYMCEYMVGELKSCTHTTVEKVKL